MSDLEKIKALITGSNSCISINTFEEQYALELIRQAALDLQQQIVIWSVSRGVREGLFSDSQGTIGTQSPPEALSSLGELKPNTICVFLDIAEYLKEARTLRWWREAILELGSKNSTMIMVDSSCEIPAITKAYTKAFELTMPGP
jgi:hypothetical protein